MRRQEIHEFGNKEILIASNVSKTYRIYNKKRDRIRELINKENSRHKNIKAIDNVSFCLNRGETLGIVGRNGSGKSTLLQMICGILTPTNGEIMIRGKIAALLELGSGFNPEFSGRENIYLNASLFGLNKNETEKRLKEIIQFSEIEEFIDQPVKTYSSGMIVRLAFSVITNVDADILIIDEALAVGDAFFNQKCMRFLRRFKEKGSIIFVSHDANAVLSLCDRAILIEKGRCKQMGAPKEIIETYTSIIQQSMQNEETENQYAGDEKINQGEVIDRSKSRWKDYRADMIKNISPEEKGMFKICEIDTIVKETFKSSKLTIQEVNLRDEETGKKINALRGGEVVELEIITNIIEDINNIICGFIIKNEQGLTIIGDNTMNGFQRDKKVNACKGEDIKTSFIFTMPLLTKGRYSICISVASGSQEKHRVLNWINDALILESQCSNIGAGIAGVPMHSIKMETI